MTDNQDHEKLTGRALVAKTKTLKHLNISETARQCGYYRIDKNGKIRIELKKYYDALMIAQNLKNDHTKTAKRGRQVSNVTSTQKNGNIVVSSAHTSSFKFPEGTKWTIKVASKKITLERVDAE
jgi:AbrB-like transcriptional regulator